MQTSTHCYTQAGSQGRPGPVSECVGFNVPLDTPPRNACPPPADQKPKIFKTLSVAACALHWAKNRIFLSARSILWPQNWPNNAFSADPSGGAQAHEALPDQLVGPTPLSAFGARHVCPRPNMVPLRCFRAGYTGLPHDETNRLIISNFDHFSSNQCTMYADCFRFWEPPIDALPQAYTGGLHPQAPWAIPPNENSW